MAWHLGAAASWAARVGLGLGRIARGAASLALPIVVVAGLMVVRAGGIDAGAVRGSAFDADGPVTGGSAAALNADPATVKSIAADLLAATTAKGGSGYRFEIVQRSTLHAKPGGPALLVPDPADPKAQPKEADEAYLIGVVETGYVTAAGFSMEMRAGPASADAPVDLASGGLMFRALLRDGVTYRDDGEGWDHSYRLPGIGLDPVTAAALPWLLRHATDARDADLAAALGELGKARATATRGITAAGTVADIPARGGRGRRELHPDHPGHRLHVRCRGAPGRSRRHRPQHQRDRARACGRDRDHPPLRRRPDRPAQARARLRGRWHSRCRPVSERDHVMTTRRFSLARRLRTVALATVLAATSFVATAVPAARTAGAPSSSPFDGIVQIADQLFAPRTALASFCASNPAFTGRLTASTASHTAVSRITDPDVYAYISNVDQTWSCTAYLRYDGVAWNTTSSKGRFDWGDLTESTSVPCNYVVGSTDYVEGKPDRKLSHQRRPVRAPGQLDQGARVPPIHRARHRGRYQLHPRRLRHPRRWRRRRGALGHRGGSGQLQQHQRQQPPRIRRATLLRSDGLGTSQTITYDRTAPTIAFTYPAAGWSAVVPSAFYIVKFEATDNLAGFGGSNGWSLQRQIATWSGSACGSFANDTAAGNLVTGTSAGSGQSARPEPDRGHVLSLGARRDRPERQRRGGQDVGHDPDRHERGARIPAPAAHRVLGSRRRRRLGRERGLGQRHGQSSRS